MIFVLMMFFGIMGMIAYSRDPDSYENFSKLGYLSIFDLIRNLPQFWHYVTLVLLTLLAASSIDTLQNGLASIFSHDLIKCKLSPNWSRLLIVGLNIGAVIMSSRRYEVVPLFLVADLVAATAVFPLFLGIRNVDWVFGGEDSRLPMLPKVTIPAPTELGAFLGAISAMIAVVINGEINNVHKAINPYTGKVYDRSALAYFWLIQNPTETCPLCGKKTMVTFIVVPLVGLVFTLFWSFLDVLVGGDKARQPFCFIPRLDRDDEEDAMLGDVRLDEKN
jgi:Na+/proline symporter